MAADVEVAAVMGREVAVEVIGHLLADLLGKWVT